MTIERPDDELERLLRAHYHTVFDGLKPPQDLMESTRSRASASREHHSRLAPLLAFALAGASFVIVLLSSRMAEILLNM